MLVLEGLLPFLAACRLTHVWLVWWQSVSWGPSFLWLEKTCHVATQQDMPHQLGEDEKGALAIPSCD